MSGNQQIHISKDANGNVFISGDGNIVIVQATRTIEPEQPAVSPAIGPNPYKGLSAFLEEDAECFFGREKLIRDLWKKFRSLHEFQPGSAGVSPAQGVRKEDSPPLVGGVRGGGAEQSDISGHSDTLSPPPNLPHQGGGTLTSTAVEVRGGGSSLRLLAILGPSGSGKSSVVRAGLIPELARRPLPDMRRARVAVVIPGNDPIGALAITLARIATNDPSPAAKSREFAAEIRRRSVEGECDGLLWIARNLPDIEIAPLIVLIDQFEEVYAPPKKKAIKEQQKAIKERQQFIDNLLHAAADPSKYVFVIITLRSDFLGQTQSHPAFNQAIARHGEIIPVMDEAELRAAIVKPAENAGHALDNACADLLIEQTRDREGALPLLQFALERIWDGLAEGVAPADTLKRIGGVGGALAGEAQRLYEKLPDKDKPIARRAFLALVQLGEGTRDTRRRISLAKIVAHGEEPAHVQAVIRCFADPRTRLVTLSATPDGAETAEVTHEALLEHWDTLREWLDDNREDLRFHRHLDQDADYWEKQGKPDGKLWRPPDLEYLQDYHNRAGQDMTALQKEFLQKSLERQEREHAEKEEQRQRELEAAQKLAREAKARQEAEKKARHEAEQRANEQARSTRRLRWLAVGLAVVFLIAVVVAFFAIRQSERAMKAEEIAQREKEDARHQSRVSMIRSLVAYSYKEDAQASREGPASQEDAQASRERAALLARLAFILNERFTGGDDVDNEIDDALRTIFRTSAILEGPGHVATRKELRDLVCQSVRFKKALTPDEWGKLVSEDIAGDIAREATCPESELPDEPRLPLRSKPMTTTDKGMEALSLNLREDSGLGYPIQYVRDSLKEPDDRFEDRGEVVVDRATGLMWQKSGSEDQKTYQEAQKYIEQLKQQKFAGYDDWRLPTIEELVSLLEPKKNEQGLYIDPIFDGTQWWYWSVDLRQIKGEGSAESAWGVDFSSGGVNWSNLGSSNYVRAVRS